MDSVKKRDDRPKPRLSPFILAWALGCFCASWLYILAMSHVISTGIVTGRTYVILFNMGLFASISTAQFFVIRRFLRVEFRAWAPLAVVGVLAGIVILELLPGLIPRFPERAPAAQFGFVLMWIMPTIFQWSVLRQRFVYHGLWLLAAVVMGPIFAFVYGHNDGIVKALFPDNHWIFVRTAVLAADFVLPSIVLGMVLYVVISQGGKPVKDKRAGQ